jgi:hypothetical protein
MLHGRETNSFYKRPRKSRCFKADEKSPKSNPMEKFQRGPHDRLPRQRQIVNYSEISDEAFCIAYMYDQPNEALYTGISDSLSHALTLLNS